MTDTEFKFGTWYPIETAPRDGKPILVLEGDQDYYAACRSEDCDSWSSSCGQPVVYIPEPDYWTPLPPAPEGEIE